MIELVSLHILKTGGMSFIELLRQHYGKDYVYHYIEKDNSFVKLKRYYKLHTISSKAKAIHGHFVFRDVEHIVSRHNPKVVVWFRDPIKRIVSRYHYLMKNIAEDPNHSKISWKNDSLIEFARRPSQMNVMSRFIDGISLNDLYFFGFLEQFEEDLKEFSKKMGWPYTGAVHKNSNAAYLSKVNLVLDDKTLGYLKEINYLDMELYTRAITLKGGIS